MAIPNVDRSAIERALAQFDRELRGTPDWASWDTNRAQVWAIDFDGKKYPPKKIISMATGIALDDFSGGPESNEYLAKRDIAVTRLRSTGLAETFSLILERYSTARATTRFAGNHEIKELFTGAKRHLEALGAVQNRTHLNVVASYGKGNWAAIPWISILDDRVTDTTQDGTYIVYSFQGDGRGMYVSLMQGVTKPQEEFKSRAAEELARRAEGLRGACASLVTDGFDVTGQTSLISDLRLAKLYEAATIAAKHYSAAAMPDDAQIEADLAALVKCYTRMVEMTDLLVRTPGQRSKIALIGTAREIANQAAQIRQQIDRNGAWAWWWSFAIREDALPRLTTPFHVYAYIGDRRLGARLRVDDFKTSRGLGGIESPWPDATDSDLVGKRSAGEKQSDVFKTWFKVGAIEMFNPPVQVDRFDLVPGLSTPENVLNQNSFGYVIDDETLTASPAQPALVAAEESSALVTPLPAPLDLDWLIKRTGLSQGVLAEMVDSIMSTSPQIMLAGPPGTSKSWVARQLSLYLARERPGHVKFVQFHPGYSYEAFVEGLRPVTRSGAVSFELTPGTVKATVNAMSDAGLVGVDGQEFVIVMDEANRANLPRVLGELMFLFEYRGEPIDLQYSSAFSLPRNLRFIATMNTADRSIRSIDVALRRRFDVFELRPDAELLARFVEGSEVRSDWGLSTDSRHSIKNLNRRLIGITPSGTPSS